MKQRATAVFKNTSGAGEWQGLRGEIRISVTAAGEHSVELDYEFE